MKRTGCWVVIVAALLTGNAMAVEEAKYTVVLNEDSFEVRQYAPHVLAETVVDGDLEGAGNKAFNLLFKYIDGNNKKQEKVAMTAPVSQGTAGEKIAMTAPVGQQRENDKWVVSFMIPASYTLESLPEPNDLNVILRQVPARYMTAVRYSGFWSEKVYRRHLDELTAWMAKQGIKPMGEPIWARYNPPFMPWFLRRNEILVPVEWPVKSQ